MPIPPLGKRPAFAALAAHQSEIADRHLRELFAEDPTRGERLCAEAVGLYLDYSKNRVTDETMRLLVELAQQSDLEQSARPDVLRARGSTSPRIVRFCMSPCACRRGPR